MEKARSSGREKVYSVTRKNLLLPALVKVSSNCSLLLLYTEFFLCQSSACIPCPVSRLTHSKILDLLVPCGRASFWIPYVVSE